MNNLIDFFTPINSNLTEFINELPKSTIGKVLTINKGDAIDFQPYSVVLFGIPEDRNAINNLGTGSNLDSFRKEFYQMFTGNWKNAIYDLGDLIIGNTINDTEVVLKEILTELIKARAIPFIIGGSHALTYPIYRTFDNLEQRVNLSVIDSKFDLGSIDSEIDSNSYLTKIIMDKPNNLINFSNFGYQTFQNVQEEIILLETLLFDTYRLGEIKNDLEQVEPILREADILSIDINSIRRIDAPANNNNGISGFNAEDICTITRYAGLSDRLKVMGIFEYNAAHESTPITAELLAQMLWYFIEGVNGRHYEFPSQDLEGFKKFMIVIDKNTHSFYKSNKSNRWWMEIFIKEDTKIKRRTLVPCTYRDYLSATQLEIPKRWYVNRKKLN